MPLSMVFLKSTEKFFSVIRFFFTTFRRSTILKTERKVGVARTDQMAGGELEGKALDGDPP